ncbi:DegT/DnrJ/EryC1/StrS family aminotransferase [Polaribacter litorisediminis]|uniref:DegT/DnrJ/EryC1/StrS family aminotransferase n=1 Tax=Polaribacter litorisediminis TaxID=1908341 RepID=UPI0020C7B69D|nr:DegT/DnrJ/EryC1/StrS family aminotransferase [Polaribacter litorisediminis]UAM96633.1 DegT/DnrJ/EryC1/StrS family aminotransferase [Polaribacter litorisediminis]
MAYSKTSLPGTKLFNTAEGRGCIITNDVLYDKLKRIYFFGYNDAKDIVEEGFNGKLTNIHNALGLANLKYYDQALEYRREKYIKYKEALSKLEFVSF